MIDTFKVSVIIPVYNAETYLRTAVTSAVQLEEVGEVILVEDASPDKALQVALDLEQEFSKVKVLQHPDKGNHGAGASRNLGIRMADCDYIAFLDADDYYLPHRFKQDAQVFHQYPDTEGVYSCVGTHFYDETAKQLFFDNGFGYQEMLTLSADPGAELLFQVLFHRHPSIKGEFCTDGITVKKTVFNKVGYFHNGLRLRQDIHLWRRLAGFCRLYAGQIDSPVAMRGIHTHNRMTRTQDHLPYIDVWWQSLRREFKNKQLSKDKYLVFAQCYRNYLAGHTNKLKAFTAIIQQATKQPSSIVKAYGDFDFNFWKVFGENWWTLHLISFKNRILSSKIKSSKTIS